MTKKIYTLFIIFMLMIVSIAGCSKNDVETIGFVEDSQEEVVDSNDEQEDEIEEVEIDYEKIKPNEAGQIMVLMYHSIGDEEKIFTRTPDNLKKDLQTLYDLKYRPISLEDYATGNINVEAGCSPVVLTFDDGHQNNFNVIEKEDGTIEIDPLCAVSILEEFNKKHPDFPLEATFFLNGGTPFRQSEHLEFKIKYLIEKGMDIGNHTANHIDLSDTNDPEKIISEITKVNDLITQYVPDYEVNTLSLPFGGKPQTDELKQIVIEGDNGQYKNIAIVEVGWDPYKSPFDKDFNPYAIHRVRASDLQEYVKGCGINDWIQRIEKGERTKFISDGSPDKVTVPEKYKDKIDVNKIGDRELITYTLEETQ